MKPPEVKTAIGGAALAAMLLWAFNALPDRGSDGSVHPRPLPVAKALRPAESSESPHVAATTGSIPRLRVVSPAEAKWNWRDLFDDLHERVGRITDNEVAEVLARNPCRGSDLAGLFILGRLSSDRILGDKRLFDSMSPSQAALLLLDKKLPSSGQQAVLSKWASEDSRSATVWAELCNTIKHGERLEVTIVPGQDPPPTRSHHLESIRSTSELLRSLGRNPQEAIAYASLYWGQPYSNLISAAASEVIAGRDIGVLVKDYAASERLLDLFGIVAENSALSNADYEHLLMVQHALLEDQRKKAGLERVAEIEEANADWRMNQERLAVLHAVPEILLQCSPEEGEQFLRLIESRGSLAAVDDYMARNPDSLTRLKLVRIEPGDIPYLR